MGGAVVREIECKSALVKSGIEGVDFVLNPYTGCAHSCVYCYAQFMTRFRPHPEPWGRFVDVKVNFARTLDRESRRLFGRSLCPPGDEPVEVMLSSVTDPYQPVEREYGITRACLKVLSTHSNTSAEPPVVSVLTKSDLVVRDLDVLATLPSVDVGFTVTTPDDRVSATLEPGAPVSSRRLSAMEALSGKGIPTWAFFGPVIPHYSDRPEVILRLFKMFASAGARRVLVDRVNLYPSCLGGLQRAFRNNAAAASRLGFARSRPDEYEAELRALALEAGKEVSLEVEVVF
ncbi:MAG: radical SAM protein [Firmicutes bacterium]|nr:radical SAM protein [Bacillota bacterium]